MMPKFGDTPNLSDPSLCLSCRCALIIKGRGLSDELTLCRAGSGMADLRITRPVVECNSYDDKRQPSLNQLEKIAWRVCPDNRKKTTGFFRPTEWQAKVKAEGIEEADIHELPGS